ncbi:MAG: sugar MFS transporter [Candidatus Acidiferrales bacterium]|jgi:FHS family L-fucose permease-like MFS transporter
MANVGSSKSSDSAASFENKTNVPALAMVTTLFFVWGFLTSLNDVLIPHFKNLFGLKYAGASLVQTAFFASYFVFSLPSGKLIEAIGYKKAMVAGLLVMAAGAFLFIPAASVASYPFFLAALIVLAAGMTVLQVSANPYVTALGPERTSSSRLNLAQAFNSLGTTVGPPLGGLLILGAATLGAAELTKLTAAQVHDYQLQQAAVVKMPYLGFGLVLVVLAAIIAWFQLPKIGAVEGKIERQGGSVWNYPHLLFGVVAIFVYVGAEVSIGSYLINYFNLSDIANLPLEQGAKLVSYYWGGAMVGRFIGSALQQKIKPNTLLGIAALVAGALVCASMLTFGNVAMWTILAVGLFNSIMFPTIFALSIEGLGPLTAEGSTMLVAAIVGGAIIPYAQGAIADRIGLHHAFFLPVICYLYIAFFGFRGSKHA